MDEWLNKKAKICIISKNHELYYTGKILKTSSEHITFIDKFDMTHTFKISDIKEINEIKEDKENEDME